MQKNTALIVYATVHGQAELVARRPDLSREAFDPVHPSPRVI